METEQTPPQQHSENVLVRNVRIVAVDADTARDVDEYGQTHPEVISMEIVESESFCSAYGSYTKNHIVMTGITAT